MKKSKAAPADPPVEITCANCAFWDTGTPNDNEPLLHGYQKHSEFACRYLPQVFYKKAEEWCAQFQADHSKPVSS